MDYFTALGRTLLAVNRVKVAVSAFTEIAYRAARVNSVDWLVRNVKWQVRAGDEQGARKALEKAIQIDSRNLSAQIAFFRLELAANKGRIRASWRMRMASLASRSFSGNRPQFAGGPATGSRQSET